MSRIGKLPIAIPAGVNVKVENGVVSVKGPKGELSQKVDSTIEAKVEDGQIVFTRENDLPQNRANHGLYRALVQNMITGVSTGYSKTLELVGVGFRASNQGQILELSLGFSHNIYMQLPSEIKITTVTERNQNPLIPTNSCLDKFVPRYVRSASPSLTKVKEYCLKVKLFAKKQVKPQANNR